MRDAFIAVDPTISDENFLKRFRDAGCYLIDLCAFAELNSDCVATLVRSIEADVRRAAGMARFSICPIPDDGFGIEELLQNNSFPKFGTFCDNEGR